MSDSMVGSVPSPRSARAAALERRRALSHNGAAALGKKSSSSSPTREIKENNKSFSNSQRQVSPQETNSGSWSNTKTGKDQGMSDSTIKTTPSPRSARAAALERRRALSHNGAAALGKKSSSSSPSRRMRADKSFSTTPREVLSQGVNTESRFSTKTTEVPVVASVEETFTVQRAVPSNDCGCGDDKIPEIANNTTEPLRTLIEDNSFSVRQLNRQRRSTLSRQGKLAVAKSFNTRVSPSPYPKPSPVGALAGMSGREAARAHREVLCQQGRGSQLACRPSGRIRQRPPVPVKVEEGTTLSGTPVTGTQVERSVMVTGVESGSCRNITGTEYIGSEQYEMLCTSIPEPAPAKVGLGRTARGQSVSGTEVGSSSKVTGDEHGLCKVVTGTEYLSADKFESFCATKPFLPPAKVNTAITEAGQNVSGTEVGGSVKVTGDEAGSYRTLTGSQYYHPESSSDLRQNGSMPHKVSVMRTLRDQVLTGTEATPGDNVTGADHGACANVTGTESGGLAQYQACNRKPVPAPEKVSVMRTWHDQPVSGTQVERSLKVTGDELGSCQPVTGTEYAGPDQYTEFCPSDSQADSRSLMSRRSGSVMMTGVQLGGPDNKVTGFGRGERMVLSGTPYGVNQDPATTPEMTGNGNFSIATPARTAQDSSLNRVTGTAYGTTGRRITGPVNLAAGLVSGTPEFRYRDEFYEEVVPPQPAAGPEVPYSRLSGNGREGGFTITGAGWRRNESITGTEGASTRRNPTLRGGQPGTGSGAFQMKDRERPDMPASRLTGSSESTTRSSSITYSGGTRG